MTHQEYVEELEYLRALIRERGDDLVGYDPSVIASYLHVQANRFRTAEFTRDADAFDTVCGYVLDEAWKLAYNAIAHRTGGQLCPRCTLECPFKQYGPGTGFTMYECPNHGEFYG